MSKRIITVCILLLLGCLSGCGAAGYSESSKELSKAINGPPESIDPQVVSSIIDAEVVTYYMGTLFTYNEHRELVPGLAESYDLSEDACTYTFHLREGLKWSNGTPLTADDFVYGFQRLADPMTGSNSVYFITDCSSVKNAADINYGKLPVSELGVSAPDNRTFVVELDTPCPYFTALTSQVCLAPVNRAFCISCGDTFATSAETVLCCGPYILDRYEPLGTQIHMVKNPYYYNADSIRIEGLNLQVIANVQQGMMCYQAGTLDIVSVSGELAELAADDRNMLSFSTAGLFYIDMDHRTNENLKNLNIRMAMAKSIDRESIVKNVLHAGYAPISRIIPADFYRDSDGEDFAGDKGQYDEYLGYDPQKAREYWNKGLSELGVSSISLDLMYISTQQNMVEAMADQLEKNLPGLEIVLKPTTPKIWGSARTKGGYDLLFMGWIADYADPTGFYMLFVSSAGALTYDNPDFDKLYRAAGKETDSAKRDELLHEMEDLLCKDVAAVPIFCQSEAYLVSDKVKGFMIYPTGGIVVTTGMTKEVK